MGGRHAAAQLVRRQWLPGPLDRTGRRPHLPGWRLADGHVHPGDPFPGRVDLGSARADPRARPAHHGGAHWLARGATASGERVTGPIVRAPAPSGSPPVASPQATPAEAAEASLALRSDTSTPHGALGLRPGRRASPGAGDACGRSASSPPEASAALLRLAALARGERSCSCPLMSAGDAAGGLSERRGSFRRRSRTTPPPRRERYGRHQPRRLWAPRGPGGPRPRGRSAR